MIFKEDFKIGIKDVKNEFYVGNKYILECLENIASRHSDIAGYGMNNIFETKLTWVLLEWKLQVIKRPKYGDIMTVHTWARSKEKCYSCRDFEVYNTVGEKCAIASSKWLLIDIKRGKPVRIEDDMIAKYNPEYNRSVFENLNFIKLEELEKYQKYQNYEIRRSDIDINGHMHNLNYIDFIYNSLSNEDFNKEYDNLRVTYKKEIKFGNKVNYYYLKINNKHHVVVKDDDNKNVHAIIEMY